jgi:methionyl-tRNA formyltransferase
MGDAETGVGIMQMEAGLDTGPVYVERRTPILSTDTTPVLHDRLVDLGIEALLETLQYAEQGCLPAPRQQSVEGVCYAEKIRPDEARLNWADNAEHLARQIRAFYPAPGAWTMLGEKRFKVGAAHVIQAPSSASDMAVGQLFSYKYESRVFPAVLCGEGSALCLERLQPAGSAYVEADKWWGHQAEGICFE